MKFKLVKVTKILEINYKKTSLNTLKEKKTNKKQPKEKKGIKNTITNLKK